MAKKETNIDEANRKIGEVEGALLMLCSMMEGVLEKEKLTTEGEQSGEQTLKRAIRYAMEHVNKLDK